MTKLHTLIFRTFYVDVGRMSPLKMKDYIDNLKKDSQNSQTKIETDLENRITFINHWIPMTADQDGGRQSSRVDITSIVLPGEV